MSDFDDLPGLGGAGGEEPGPPAGGSEPEEPGPTSDARPASPTWTDAELDAWIEAQNWSEAGRVYRGAFHEFEAEQGLEGIDSLLESARYSDTGSHTLPGDFDWPEDWPQELRDFARAWQAQKETESDPYGETWHGTDDTPREPSYLESGPGAGPVPDARLVWDHLSHQARCWLRRGYEELQTKREDARRPVLDGQFTVDGAQDPADQRMEEHNRRMEEYNRRMEEQYNRDMLEQIDREDAERRVRRAGEAGATAGAAKVADRTRRRARVALGIALAAAVALALGGFLWFTGNSDGPADESGDRLVAGTSSDDATTESPPSGAAAEGQTTEDGADQLDVVAQAPAPGAEPSTEIESVVVTEADGRRRVAINVATEDLATAWEDEWSIAFRVTVTLENGDQRSFLWQWHDGELTEGMELVPVERLDGDQVVQDLEPTGRTADVTIEGNTITFDLPNQEASIERIDVESFSNPQGPPPDGPKFTDSVEVIVR